MTINREQVLEKELYKVTLILNEIKEMLNKTDMESIPMYGLADYIRLKLIGATDRIAKLEEQLNNIMYEINTNFQPYNLDRVVNQLFPYMVIDSNGNSVCKDYWQCGQILNDKLKPKTL